MTAIESWAMCPTDFGEKSTRTEISQERLELSINCGTSSETDQKLEGGVDGRAGKEKARDGQFSWFGT